MITMRQLNFIACAFALIFCFERTQTAGKLIYIVSLANESCPAEPCITISQYAINTVNDYLGLNITLVFLPGNHSLYHKMAIKNVSTLTITALFPTSQAIVICMDCTGFVFSAIHQVHISGLVFVGCGGSKVELVNQFTLVNCSIFGGQVNCGSGLHLFNVSAKIANSSFISNLYGSEQMYELSLFTNTSFCTGSGGGAISISHSDTVIVSSLFEGNHAEMGGAIVAKDFSNTTIINTTFVRNQAECRTLDCICSGGAFYCESGCIVRIYNSFFFNNSGDKGGVFRLAISTIFIEQCTFEWNIAKKHGSTLSTIETNVMINNSTFINNVAEIGGVLSIESCTSIVIKESNFTDNEAQSLGGVLFLKNIDSVDMDTNYFINNFASKMGGAVYGNRLSLYTIRNIFMKNMGSCGGAIALMDCNISMTDCESAFNDANFGGVLYFTTSTANSIDDSCIANSYQLKVEENSALNVEIIECKFYNNTAHIYGGALCFEIGNEILINGSKFYFNTGHFGGGMYIVNSSHILVSDCDFTNNDAWSGGVMHIERSAELIMLGVIAIENNNGDLAVIYLQDSIAIFSGILTAFNNVGSLFLVRSNATIIGNASFINCSSLLSYEPFYEAGAITVFEFSNLTFAGHCTLHNNSALNGGAIYGVKSQIFISAGTVSIIDNVALSAGGGIFMYKSEFYCDTEYPLQNTYLNISGNNATNRGGGIYAISSTIKLGEARIEIFPSSVNVNIDKNKAKRGGGMYLEANTKLKSYLETTSLLSLNKNLAEYGGAIFVADDTSPGACFNTSYEEYTDCFMQVLKQNKVISNFIPSYSFKENYAVISGHNLYGGLLDRCSIHYIRTPIGIIVDDVIFVFEHIINVSVDTISSDPMKVCFCTKGKQDCSYQPPSIQVKKGSNFIVSVIAIDQVNHVKTSVPVHSYLRSSESNLAKGQVTQITTKTCSDLTYTIYSPHKSEELTLYASGPCKDANPSQGRITINFLPCKCPVGFQEIETNTRCECVCDHRLFPYITQCEPTTQQLVREGDFWISNTTSSTDFVEYLIYPHCPLDYCTRTKILVNLNTQNGTDIQCLNNRNGKLCGGCKQDFSLSLGSSSCIVCPGYWPALLVGITVLSALAGVGLIALLLELNLTVGIGTLNGLIFYANIVDANRGTFFSSSNFVTVVIAWVNLDVGFDVCFFNGMNSYWKIWLQLVFPAYVIILVIVVIFISERHTKFARLIGRRNPVATLATLILLSYTKFLQTVIVTLSFAIPEGSSKIAWLSDASIGYLSGKHIPLFFVAVLILLVGIVYTTILFSWQWCLYYQNKWLLKWVKYQQLHLFLEPYLAPYTVKHRYWTGLLLLVRVFLYLFTVSVSTVVHEPTRWNLLITAITVLCLLLPRIIFGIKIYKSMFIDILETISYLNILMFCIAKLFIKIDGNEQTIVAYLSGLLFFVLLLFVILHHFITEVFSKTVIWKKLFNRKRGSFADNAETYDINDNKEQEVPTTSLVERPSHRESLPVMMGLAYQDENGDQSFNEPANTLPIAGHHSAYPYQLMKSSASTV